MFKRRYLLAILTCHLMLATSSFSQCPTITSVTAVPSVSNCAVVNFTVTTNMANGLPYQLGFGFNQTNANNLTWTPEITATTYTTSYTFPATNGTYTYYVAAAYADCGAIIVTKTISINCSACTNYSILSTGFNRATQTYFSYTQSGYFDPYWNVVERQDVYDNPPLYPIISGTKVSFNVPCYFLYFSSLPVGNARYISYDVMGNSSYNTRNISTYRTYFKLPKPLPTNKKYTLNLSMRCDDGIYAVRLNGRDLKTSGDYYSPPGGGSYVGLPLDISVSNCTYFKEDSNYVDIVVGDLGLGATELAADILLKECPSGCTDLGFTIPQKNICSGSPVTMTADPHLLGQTLNWDFGDGTTGTGFSVSHVYAQSANYQVVLKNANNNTVANNVTVNDCELRECENCLGSFRPTPGKYVISLWVNENVTSLPQSYTNAKVEISFTGSVATPVTVVPNGTKNKIIDGWQRIEETFDVPADATELKLKLINSSPTIDAFFDDIRIFPLDGQMKTYVYDPITLRLMSILDENNYASFYEYDEEGKLIRIKKETERGIMTIQETREGNKKK